MSKTPSILTQALLLLFAGSSQAQTVPADAYEADNTKATAKAYDLATATTQSRNFHVNGDFDWVSVDVPVGATGTLNLAAVAGQASNRWRGDLWLTSPAGDIFKQTVLFGSTATPAGTLSLPNTATVPLRYVLRVSYSGSMFSGLTSRYSLSGSGGGSPPPAPYEPNNDWSAATSILGGSPQDHSFHAVGDQDWLVYWLNAGQGSSISITPSTFTTTNRWRATLYRRDDGASAPSLDMPLRTADFGPQTLNWFGLESLSNAGRGYYLKVVAIDPNFTGSQSNYRVSVNGAGFAGGPFEPNNFWSDATSILGGVPQDHGFHNGNDEDWLRYWLTAGQSTQMIITPATATASNQWRAELYQQQDGVVTPELTTPLRSAELGPQPLTWTGLDAPAGAGRGYYLRMVPLNGHSGVASNYRVSVVGSAPGGASMTIAASPTSNLIAPATTRLSATVNTGGLTVTQVEYLRAGQRICGPVSVAPYNCDWSQIPAGTHTVMGRTTFSNSSTVDSSTLDLVVNAPQVSNCSFADWSQVVGTPIAGEPDDAIAVPRYRGRCGIQADSIGDYLVDATPSDENVLNTRFYFYTGNRSGSADIYQARNANGVLVRVQHDGNALHFSESSSATVRSVNVADNRWYAIRLNWSAGAGNGSLVIKLVGAGSSTALDPPAITGLNNASARIEEVRLGLIGGSGSGAVGFEEFEARRYSTPMRFCRGDANNDQAISNSDITAINAEIAAGGAPTAPGQPDANEDGVVNAADATVVSNLINAAQSCASL